MAQLLRFNRVEKEAYNEVKIAEDNQHKNSWIRSRTFLGVTAQLSRSCDIGPVDRKGRLKSYPYRPCVTSKQKGIIHEDIQNPSPERNGGGHWRRGWSHGRATDARQ